MMPARSRQERRRPYLKSGVYTLKRAVQTLGSRALPTKRTALGRTLHEWRSSLVPDLGGADDLDAAGRAGGAGGADEAPRGQRGRLRAGDAPRPGEPAAAVLAPSRPGAA